MMEPLTLFLGVASLGVKNPESQQRGPFPAGCGVQSKSAVCCSPRWGCWCVKCRVKNLSWEGKQNG